MCYLSGVCAVVYVVKSLRVLLCQPVGGRFVLLPPLCGNAETPTLLGLFALGCVSCSHSC